MGVLLPLLTLPWFLRRLGYVLGHPGKSAQTSLLLGSSLLSLVSLSALLFQLSSTIAVAIIGVASVLSTLAFTSVERVKWLWRLRSWFDNRLIRELWVGYWRIGRWALIQSVFSSAVLFAPILLIAWVGNLSSAGSIRTLQLLILPLQQLNVAVGMLALPRIAQVFRTLGVAEAVRTSSIVRFKLTSANLVLGVSAAVLLSQLSSRVDHLLLDFDSRLVTMLVSIPILEAAASKYSLLLRATQRTLYYPLSAIIPGAISIASSPFLVSSFGITGAVTGLLLSSLALVTVSYLLFRFYFSEQEFAK
jgi:hypothetical protein